MLLTYRTASYLLTLKLWAIIILAVVSCSMQKAQPLSHIKEGIEGYVYKKSGNQMPMKGKPANSNSKGIKGELWIFKATTIKQVSGNMPLFTQINTALVVKVKTDSTGFYRIALPAGLYSVFVKQDDHYFAAETNGQGVLNPAEVLSGKITTRNITVTTNALY